MTPIERKALKALMVMWLSHDYDSTLTVQRMAKIRQRYVVLREYELHVPLPKPEWTARTMSNNPPSLSDEESKLVRKLKGILPNSKTIKDMTKVWLLSRENTLVMAVEKRSAKKTLSALAEKCPTEGCSESSTKRKKWMTKKAEKGTSSRGDGRGSTPERDRAKAKESTKEVAKPAKMPEVDVGQEAVVVTEKRVIDLEAEVKRLKAEAQCLKVALEDTEQCCQTLEQEAERSQGEMEDLRSTRHRLDDEVLKLARDIEALQTELQSVGAKEIVEYKMFQGFELGIERIRHITYEFRYRLVLELFRAKYPDLSVLEDPFADCPEDPNI
ncbi:hypothetical protein B296_00030627 [Ensete ventricosum]|uniref:Uncharacterized protein n=1 Tax=Ensete ventricosum TaxID=4639 RepID=A0A427AIF7_ENSVE|nr:hypothetical protein B296_00030627 [Ensete ventricosum]